MTTGRQFTETMRKSFRINTRSRDRRDGGSIKADMLEAVETAGQYDGYYSTDKTATYRTASAAVASYRKHVDGYRIDGVLRYQITSMSPWDFAGLLGSMVDADVTNVGEGERFFHDMRFAAAA